MRAAVGHRFTLDMGPRGQQPCEVTDVEPERLFRYRFAVGTLDTPITFTLFAEGTGTRLRFTQSSFDLENPSGRRAFEGMKPGWPPLSQRLGRALASKG